MDEFQKLLDTTFLKVDPIDHILLVILRSNPHVTAHFNKKNQTWDLYIKKGKEFIAPHYCKWDKPYLYYKDLLVGKFHTIDT